MRAKSRGFTLLEIIIAVFVFLTTVAGVLSVWSAHARGIAKARMALIANQLGEDKMAECIAARYQLVDQFNDPPPGTEPPIEVDFLIKNKPLKAEFHRMVTVTELVPGAIKEVKVRVEWRDTTNQAMDDRSHVEFVTELHEAD